MLKGNELRKALRELTVLHRQREALLRGQGDATRRAKSLLRWAYGWEAGKKEPSRQEAIKKADAAWASFRKGELPEHWTQLIVSGLSTCLAQHDAPTETLKDLTKGMEKRGAELPGAGFVRETRGLSMLSFAQLAATAGDLANYATPAKLWKYMGAAPPSEYEMVTKAGKVAKNEPRPHKKIWFFLASNVVKANGPLRALYDERKARHEADGWGDDSRNPKGHRHNDATRYLGKRLMLEIWKAWNRDLAG